jgi:hypothetical protein
VAIRRICTEQSDPMKKTLMFAATTVLMAASMSASATLISTTFTADGVTGTTSQQGTAVFTFDTTDLTFLTITLTDNVDPTALIASELDGLEFTFSDAPLTMTLQSVSPQSVINCNNSVDPCPTVTASSPYGWGTTLTGSDGALGAGFTGAGFSYHPFAIVNTNYDAPGGNGGISNDQHNPLLVGPVTFTFLLSGLQGVPEITSVNFLFGTVPDSQPGTPGGGGDVSVPEPQTLALLGLGLVSLAWMTRRKRRGA